MMLRIDLQDGFSNDTVVIQVNDKEVYKKNVTTLLILGVADSFELDIPGNSAAVKISVPSRGLSEMISIELAEPIYLGISIRSDQITTLIHKKPFAYF